MNLVKNTTWEQIFEGWRKREANNPDWIEVATKIKGWPDWESWRKFTASQINADKRNWQIFEFSNPIEEIPTMLIGPYSGWQSRIPNKNKTAFIDLLNIPEQYEHFSNHKGILSIINGLPFTTEFIGLIRDDINRIVCIEGHHRATAIALIKKHGKQIDFSKVKVTIALARLPASESSLFDELTERGTSKNNQD